MAEDGKYAPFSAKTLLTNAEGLLTEVLLYYREQLNSQAVDELFAIRTLLQGIER
jgi:hypothetical protein